MKSNVLKHISLLLFVVMIFGAARALPTGSINVSAAPVPEGVDPTAIERAKAGGAKVSIAPATGGVNFLVLGEQQMLTSTNSVSLLDPTAQAASFLQSNRGLFGISDASQELTLVDNSVDHLGARHLTYEQTYNGLPVFAGVMKVHFNTMGRIAVVNGIFVPQIDVPVNPTVAAEAAGAAAVRSLEMPGVSVQQSTLMIYRDGLIQGITGKNHLAYEIEVGDGKDSRDFVYVDAHTGKILNTIEGVVSLHRRVLQYDMITATTFPVWQDGDPAYTGADPEIQAMIDTSGKIHELVKNISGGSFLSFDGSDAEMISIVDFFDPSYCPNASWNGINIRACDGLAVDDVIAHEWGHAYTDGTHNLIYQWQPGALNEAYSDIFGEIIDITNGAGTDTPDVVRSKSTCAVDSAIESAFKVNTPDTIAGYYPVGTANFGPPPLTPVTQNIVMVNDGFAGTGGTYNDGCEPFINSSEVAGKIAMVERGLCNFTVKVENAQKAGAAAVLIYNNALNGETIINMNGTPTEPITIPSVLIQRSAGLKIIANLVNGVNGTVSMYPGADGGPLVDTVRWLMGEDAAGGVLRDMWDPTCMGNPGKVSDTEYYCSTADNGGVHYNSGVPGHAFALLVDGGAYNGQTIAPIGMTRAAAIYWRAQKEYQVPATDFAGHADALETSCTDLIGQDIYNLETGSPVSAADRITAAHCTQVQKAMLAVEMRASPDQCGFQPLLDTNIPPVCEAGQGPLTTFLDTFESAGTGWTVTHEIVDGVTASYYTPDWELTGKLPKGRTGSAFFALNHIDYGLCTAVDDQTSLRSLISPEVTVPNNVPFRLSFDHYVATELGYDGGNLWIQVNGGEWMLVDWMHFNFNTYTYMLRTTEGGNTNPLQGQPAFTGTDGGTVTGSWVTSQVDLSGYAQPGDKIKLAFNMGQDGCNGSQGWYVDNVRLYTCGDSTYIPLIGR